MKIAIWQTTDRPGRLPWRSGDWKDADTHCGGNDGIRCRHNVFAVALPVAVPAGVGCRQ